MLLGCFGVAIGHGRYLSLMYQEGWFSSLEKLGSGVVIMENDIACQIIGIGTVRTKMFDDVVRDLTDVRYVPQMKKNIIPVGVVESKGFKVT